MHGRIKGDQHRTLILAHHIEMMARQKTLRAVSHYLVSEKQSVDDGAARVLALFKRLDKKGG
jgi:hypothetical protein